MLGRSRHSSSHGRKDSLHRRYAQFCFSGNREEDKTRIPYNAHSTDHIQQGKGTNGHVTMYIMYITVISHWAHPNVRIRVSIKLHLQCHLSIPCSHCTALPIPLQYHSPRTTRTRPGIWASCIPTWDHEWRETKKVRGMVPCAFEIVSNVVHIVREFQPKALRETYIVSIHAFKLAWTCLAVSMEKSASYSNFGHVTNDGVSIASYI